MSLTKLRFTAILPCISFVAAALAQIAPAPAIQDATTSLKYTFGPVAVPGYTQVSPGALFSDVAGFGFEPVMPFPNTNSAVPATEERSQSFSARVPEGNFEVKVSIENSGSDGTVTLKAESGRLMVLRAPIAPGQTANYKFTVNVRGPHLPKLPLNATGREEVSLDQFDRGNTRDWDDKLTVEVPGPHLALRTVEITSAPNLPTLFIAGDSTVTDRNSGPDVSWGQILPVFFKPGVAVANNAQSGETLKSFANALRLDKMLAPMKKGDYLFIQFAHNDSKIAWPQTYVDPQTTYKAYLKVYIAEARQRGATPVLVTAMDRGVRGTGAPTHGHGGYPQAMREVATEEHVPLIDLYAMSQQFYASAGADAAQILADGTHSTAYGGYEFAKFIVMGIKQNNLDLAKLIADGFKDFDPSHPDSAGALDLAPLFVSSFGRRGSTGANPGPGPM